MNLLIFPAKRIRAKVIADYVRAAGYPGVVVFTCGNAAKALREEGIEVLEISPRGALKAGRWWAPEAVHLHFPHLFDATSGHLPAPLMVRIGRAFQAYLGSLVRRSYRVPTGSGETIVCLRWVYPEVRFVPVYGAGAATRFEPDAPLNDAVFAGGGARAESGRGKV